MNEFNYPEISTEDYWNNKEDYDILLHRIHYNEQEIKDFLNFEE